MYLTENAAQFLVFVMIGFISDLYIHIIRLFALAHSALVLGSAREISSNDLLLIIDYMYLHVIGFFLFVLKTLWIRFGSQFSTSSISLSSLSTFTGLLRIDRLIFFIGTVVIVFCSRCHFIIYTCQMKKMSKIFRVYYAFAS